MLVHIYLLKRFLMKTVPWLHSSIPFYFSLQSNSTFLPSEVPLPTGITAIPVYSCPGMMCFISDIKKVLFSDSSSWCSVWKLSTGDESSNHWALPLVAVYYSIWMSFLSFSSCTVYFHLYL